jgi:nucleoside-diphosphate-sugar epimerase
MSPGIGIIGAGGFVGNRLVESLVLDGGHSVRAIVRAYRSFAGLCRFGSAIQLIRADAEDPNALLPAVAGCSTVINLTTGSPASIRRSTQVIYQACVEAKVARLIHLSSAVVFGEVESATIHDDSPPLTEHWMPYARAKAAAETWLRRNAKAPGCQVAVLRPGIVWGVQSAHMLGIVRALLGGTAYLVDGGRGVFNGIYVENLVDCILACHRHAGDTAGFYNVADAEPTTWRDFYTALGVALDCDVERIPAVSGKRFPWSVPAVVDQVQGWPVVNTLYHRIKKRLPDTLRARVKQLLTGGGGYEERARAFAKRPRVDRELWHLQQTRHKLPAEKFARHFAYAPAISFAEGIRRTVQWLAFVGYATPIRERFVDSERPLHERTG